MPLMKTSNPALGENTFRGMSGGGYGSLVDAANRMTLNGTVNKTGLLLICALATATWTWSLFMKSRDMGDIAAADDGGLVRRLDLCPHNQLPKRMGAGDRAHLCAVGKA